MMMPMSFIKKHFPNVKIGWPDHCSWKWNELFERVFARNPVLGGVCDWAVNTSNSKFGGPAFKPRPPCCFLRQGTLLHFAGLLIGCGKRSQISRDFWGQIRGKIGRFCRTFRGKLHWKAIGEEKAYFVVIFRANFARNRSVLCWSDQHF